MVAASHISYRISLIFLISHICCISACEEAQGLCANLLVLCSLLLVLATLPFSLCLVIKVVQEYERAVIFRLGLLLSGGARGPGVFFVIPCVDHYQKIDMRTQTYDVPPQEVKTTCTKPDKKVFMASYLDFDQRQCDGVCERYNVLQGQGKRNI